MFDAAFNNQHQMPPVRHSRAKRTTANTGNDHTNTIAADQVPDPQVGKILSPAIQRELITAPEFAELLNISERTFYRLKSIGRLPKPITLGGSIRWRLSEARQWIADGCPKPQPFE